MAASQLFSAWLALLSVVCIRWNIVEAQTESVSANYSDAVPLADFKLFMETAANHTQESRFVDAAPAAPRRGEPSNTWECERVTSVPSSVRRDMNLNWFYRKYLHAFGVPILSSNLVRDTALRRACYVLVFTLADRADVRRMFYKNRGRAAVIAEREGTTSIPEHSFLPSWWNQRARGLGGTMQIPVSTGGEENLLCLNRDRYRREDIFLHEYVHGLHNVGVTSVIRDFDRRLAARYNYLKRTGYRWRNTYAMSTDREYLSEGAQSFFEDNDEQIPTNGIHNHVDTRAELLSYDPVLYNFVKEIFPCQNRYLHRCDAAKGVQPYNFKMNCDRNGNGILMNFKTKQPVGKPNTPPPPPSTSLPNTPPPPNTPPNPNSPPPPNTPPPPITPPPPNTARPPKTSTPGCEDTGPSKDCKRWAGRGECQKNPGYMHVHCKKSCNRCGGGSCQDNNRYCASWAGRGQCQTNPRYMHVNCKKSCNRCGGGGGGSCQDNHSNCASWAGRGECNKNPGYMHKNCKRSCSKC